jgi:hypothetical protein
MTLTGIVFALVLIIIQFGLFLGFTTTTSNNIDHSNAEKEARKLPISRAVCPYIVRHSKAFLCHMPIYSRFHSRFHSQ